MDFKPIKAKKIYEEIVDQIKSMIASGTLTTGDKLLPERELAERMQVGRSAVREAYRTLEALGIIEIRPGEGTFVREIGTKSMTDIMSLVVMTEKDTLSELLELRKIIEVEAAALAAVRRTDDDIKTMKLWLDQMKQDINKQDLGELADMKFHYALADSAHNSLLMRLMNTISETMKNSLRTARQQLYLTPNTPQRLYDEHVAIYEAVVRGDVQEARNNMMVHLTNVEKGLVLDNENKNSKLNN
ncbi:GntR domain protein [Desulfotomaculum nigrificans CO-1-SRB]|uniref:GntR domain protein n=1 Tax=Desulfotomaculum nigrificans (strain DSM 14880 / VKM B-2319 / CO-1-SRB) TaxID=868595 RepID=F6B707_DESCC|nr:FadR/GntR family transcriptional regulator [Desulfotomaculum nigrificans]AEF94432.1 GntR domain protein [Desulfotomaculum nigrificans CO-1-SRB]